ncbi:MAG: IclR family transcriptional regulator [Acidobacteriota bacterium]
MAKAHPIQTARAPSMVKSASRALDVFELLVNHRQGLTVSQISRELELPVSSAFELVQTLTQRSYLEAVPGVKAYRLGLKLLEIGSTYLREFSLLDEARPIMRELVRICDETVNLAILDKTDILFMAKEEGTKSMRLVSYVGKRLPAHATALGKVLLSALSETELEALYRNVKLERLTSKTISGFASLKKELRWVRLHGYAEDEQETSAGLHCLAAPIYNHQHRVVAALSISLPSVRLDRRRLNELIGLVLSGAGRISQSIGYQAGSRSQLASL